MDTYTHNSAILFVFLFMFTLFSCFFWSDVGRFVVFKLRHHVATGRINTHLLCLVRSQTLTLFSFFGKHIEKKKRGSRRSVWYSVAHSRVATLIQPSFQETKQKKKQQSHTLDGASADIISRCIFIIIHSCRITFLFPFFFSLDIFFFCTVGGCTPSMHQRTLSREGFVFQNNERT